MWRGAFFIIYRRFCVCSSRFNAREIPFTEDAYSIGDIPVDFLNCLEKYCREL